MQKLDSLMQSSITASGAKLPTRLAEDRTTNPTDKTTTCTFIPNIPKSSKVARVGGVGRLGSLDHRPEAGLFMCIEFAKA
nr:hypothetical protein [Mycobacterium lepraemurium]